MEVTLQHTVSLYTLQCYLCSVVFGMDLNHYRRRHEDGKEFFCPNGHGQFFKEPEIKRLQKELDVQKQATERERKRKEWAEQEARAQQAEKERVEKKLRRVQKRLAKGVCPCCNRTFNNLQRHMHTKHPDYDGSTA